MFLDQKHQANHHQYNPPFFEMCQNLDKNINELSTYNKVHFFHKEDRKVEGEMKRYSKSVFQEIETGTTLSKRSYKSYYSLIGIFFLIMIPVSLLVRKLIRKRSS